MRGSDKENMINTKPIVMKRITVLLLILITSASSFAQDEKYGATEEEQLICKEALSVYKSFKTQKNYKDAYPAWQEACEVCPPKVSESLYSDGARFIKEELKKAKGDREAVLADSLMAIYDKRIELYGSTSKKPNNSCTILGYKAGDMYRYFPDQIAEVNAMFKQSMDCLGNETAASTISGYYLTSYKLLNESEAEAADEIRASMLTEYLQLQEIADYNIANETKESVRDGYMKAKANIDEIFVVIAECESMVPTFEKKVKANPEDMDLKIKALKLMEGKDCTESEFYLNTAEAVHTANPTHESAYALEMGYLKKSEYSTALKYVEQAVELCGDCPDADKYMLRAGQIAIILKQSSKARSYANKVMQGGKNNGEALMLIGDAIVVSAPQCADGGIGERAMYWLAVDYYNRAKSAGADGAGKKASTYAGQFPSTEDLFKYGIGVGTSFTTCTGESTTVRAR